MTKKSLGFVLTEWTCPNCQTRNPGPQKTCSSCGMPQPDDIKFEQAAQEELITDEAELEKAKAGPDIHCYYCGSRNSAGAATCSQCGADLTEGTARRHGEIIGAHRDKPAAKIVCDACGAENEADAARCVQCGAPLSRPMEPEPEKAVAQRAAPSGNRSKWIGGVIGLFLVLCCIGGILFVVLSNRTEDVTGTVSQVEWTRTIAIEALQPVEGEDWRADIPPEAIIGTCTEKVHHNEERATGQQREVCGTPYTVDMGSGYAEVVQDCTTENVMESVPVYADFCHYTVDEWQQIEEVREEGNNFSPQWPSVGVLGRNEREGERAESYRVSFTTESRTYTYAPSNESEFNRYELGSRWILKVNTFGGVNDTERLQ